MLLCIDIGNTNIVMGVFDEDKLVESWRISTDYKTQDEYAVIVKSMFENSDNISVKDINNVIICSVVPKVLVNFKPMIEKNFEVEKVLVVGEDIIVPVKNNYGVPGQVGQDRLVNAFAAYHIYKEGIIVVDFGTAITFDVVSVKGEYLGGTIVPGIETSYRALVQKAALLPNVEIEKPKHILGTNTSESMCSGILNGFGALCDGMVQRLQDSLSLKLKVIATGGYSELISEYCNVINQLEPELTLKGLMLIFDH